MSVSLLVLALSATARAQSLEQALAAFGAAPRFADSKGGCGGLALTSSRSTLLQTIDPSLQSGYTTPTAGLWGGAFGTGLGMYGFGMTAFFWSRPTEGPVSTWQIPGAQGHYFSGLNPLAWVQEEPRFGLAPGVVMQGGIGGGVQTEVEKLGQVYFMDTVHWHLGYGGGAYVRTDRFTLMAYGGWMPEKSSLMTLGFVEGSGRYDPDYLGTPQYDTDTPPTQDFDLMEYIMVTSNDIVVRRDVFLELKLQVGMVFFSYGVRRYDLSGKAGHELQEGSQWYNLRHTVGVGFGGVE